MPVGIYMYNVACNVFEVVQNQLVIVLRNWIPWCHQSLYGLCCASESSKQHNKPLFSYALCFDTRYHEVLGVHVHGILM